MRRQQSATNAQAGTSVLCLVVGAGLRRRPTWVLGPQIPGCLHGLGLLGYSGPHPCLFYEEFRGHVENVGVVGSPAVTEVSLPSEGLLVTLPRGGPTSQTSAWQSCRDAWRPPSAWHEDDRHKQGKQHRDRAPAAGPAIRSQPHTASPWRRCLLGCLWGHTCALGSWSPHPWLFGLDAGRGPGGLSEMLGSSSWMVEPVMARHRAESRPVCTARPETVVPQRPTIGQR